jgi:ABC-type antimicrobial peptide transport system permease subunit
MAGVINAGLAAKYWPGQSALGKRVKIEGLRGEWIEIVGVVSDTLGAGNQPRVVDTFYLTLAQGQPPGLGMGMIVRHRGVAPDARAYQRALDQLDPNMQFFGHVTPTEIYARSAWQSRFVTQLVAGFALLAVALSLAGIYAVNAFFVARRIHEFSIRAALGATRGNLQRLVLAGGLRVTAIGLAVGAVLAFAAARSLTGLLYNVPALDLAAYAGAVALMTLACLGAMLVPARRAAKVNPISALRAE